MQKKCKARIEALKSRSGASFYHNDHKSCFCPLPRWSYILNKSSSSSSHPPFRLLITIFSSSLVSATAFSRSFNCSSVIFCLNCPDRASVISLFSTSFARDSLTSLILPRRSAASGSRIWFRIDCLASAVTC